MARIYKLSSSMSDRIAFDEAVAQIARDWFNALPDDEDMIRSIAEYESARMTPCELETDDADEANARWIETFAATVADCKTEWISERQYIADNQD
ncbi:hypothetical protein [Caldilinea sp.]|uniref:hypothetical protein n=1 Tax=Caldilinea sp. TaxID=2293560 RepID=UPI002B5D5A31|nr:hypothetical protein [Caldilinea sp.]